MNLDLEAGANKENAWNERGGSGKEMEGGSNF